jgi:MATE family multidrug resistance protein
VPIILLFAFGGGPVIDLMTTAPEVRDEARRYLPWMVAAPAIGLPCWMLDGVFFGATATRALRNSTFVSTLVYVAALLVLVPVLANHGLWAAMLVLFAVRGVTLGRAYPALEASA